MKSVKRDYHGEETSETLIPKIPTAVSFDLNVSDVQPELADMELDPVVNIYRVGIDQLGRAFFLVMFPSAFGINLTVEF